MWPQPCRLSQHRAVRLFTLRVLREVVSHSHTGPKSVERLPKAREITEAIEDVGLLPGTLRVFELADCILPALA